MIVTGQEIKEKIGKLRKMGTSFGVYTESARRTFNEAAAMLEAVAKMVPCPDCDDIRMAPRGKINIEGKVGGECVDCPTCKGKDQKYPEV